MKLFLSSLELRVEAGGAGIVGECERYGCDVVYTGDRCRLHQTAGVNYTDGPEGSWLLPCTTDTAYECLALLPPGSTCLRSAANSG